MKKLYCKLSSLLIHSINVHLLLSHAIYQNGAVAGETKNMDFSNANSATSATENIAINTISRWNSSQDTDGNKEDNFLVILSTCQTVCACKWKGGKQTVECIDRELTSIPDNIDPSTQVLDMSGNNLQILPHEQFIRSNLLNLQKLFLRNSRIAQINSDAFKGLTNLVELDLSHNLLIGVPSATFSYIPFLRDLTLASNPIEKIEANSFYYISSLHKLDLSHCDIHTIAPQAFEGLEALFSLKLNGNKLSEIRPRTLEMLSRLHGIELHDNPWMCDCRMRAAKIWLTDKNIPYPVAPVCSGGPERILDRTFSDLSVEEFACRPEMLPIARYVESVTGENATITCRTYGIPSPNISWFWNGRLLTNGSAFSSHQRVYIFNSENREKVSKLILTNSQETDSSEFYCVAENKAGLVETNFTLHVMTRAAGITAFGSNQIVGLTAALVILILFILLVIIFLLVRMKRSPFSDSKTPNHLEIVTTVTQPVNTNCKQQSSSLIIQNRSGEKGGILKNVETINLDTGQNLSEGYAKYSTATEKPSKLTDFPFANTSNADTSSSVLSSASCYISPTASTGNNPDLINDTRKFNSDESLDVKLSAAIPSESIKLTFVRPKNSEGNSIAEYNLTYPSSLWSSAPTPTQSFYSDEHLLKRATSTTFSMLNYGTDKTSIIDNRFLYDLNNGTTKEYFSKTFPRTYCSTNISTPSSATDSISKDHARNVVSTTLTTSTALSSSRSISGYPSDYGLPLVPGAEQHVQHSVYSHNQQNQQYNNNISCNNNNNNKSSSTLSSTMAGVMPITAKTLRVWQKGGVPVLPPVTALKRALSSSSRNSPDEGYQEWSGTDV